MTAIVRKIHLYSALVIGTFLLMYFVTGGVMIMEHFFPRMNFHETIKDVTFPIHASEQRAIDSLVAAHLIRGSLRTDSTAYGRRYFFARPGYTAELTVRRDLSSIQVKIREGTFGAVMNYLHRLRGYEGGWVHWIWSFFYDLSCIALVAFAISGLFLWWRLERTKLPGVLCLVFSTILTGFTIWYLFSVS